MSNAGAPRVPASTNRLGTQTSPYLLQHAHNPVAWWPWSADAFAEARRRNVPIFLSIGYSTCYWCHVMERESFENEEIAGLMNERFVCIKVDREERPDVDEVYMAATVMMTGHGGWPMSVFLEPHKLRPFWCGTYFPPAPRDGARGPAFPQVLESLAKAYAEQGEGVAAQAEQVAAAVIEHLGAAPQPAELGQDQVTQAVSGLLKIFDRANGGFGSAPKFPQPVFLDFLLDVRTRASDDSTGDAIDQAVRRTLDKMACGGVRDQVGGGFHRYSVDSVWLVPHFEKMLYDNAQLAAVYARAARWYGDQEYARVARETLDYVLREMTDAAGGFYSAQDAEVDGREGLNYLWTPEEVRGALDPEDAEFAIRVYGLDQGPNFQDPHHPSEPARSVLRLTDRPERIGSAFSLSHTGFVERLAQVSTVLLKSRAQRKQPRLDDKVLAGWNGLMIGAMALAARELEEPRYIAPAERAAEFIVSKMIDRTGPAPVLMRSYRAGAATTPAFLEDHAFLVYGLLELHRASPGDGRWLRQALAVLGMAKSAFFGGDTGMMYDTREGQSDLFVRTRSTHDGAVPAGISVMINNLIDLAEMTADKAYSKRALTALIANSGAIADSPVGAVNSTRALFRMLIATEAAADALRAQGPRPKAPETGDGHLPVEIYASVDRVAVGADKPAELILVIKIPEGHHVPAAEPGEGAQSAGLSLVPFRVGIVGGTGVTAYAGYPAGEEFGSDAAGKIRVYRGTIELPVAIERSGDWSGTPLISVMYQACTDSECLRPTTVELDIAIDPA